MNGFDPERYEGLDYALDNTPWWVWDNTRGSGYGLGRCNPFGYEDSDVVVFGGTHDPKHEKHVWFCRNWAEARYRMTCVNGHAGTMRLCRAHAAQVMRRMNGVCPACVSPPRARELEAKMNELMRMIPAERDLRRRGEMSMRLEDCRREMNEMIERGQIRSGAPLRLTEVS